MKIAVVAANGRVGQLVTKEAVERGHEVTAFVREDENRSVAPHAIHKGASDITRADLEGFDVVVDAVGGWDEQTAPAIPNAAKALSGVLAGTDVRLVVVGGAGSLYVNPEHTLTVAQGPDFPESFKLVASVHQEALDFLRGVADVRWTYISPAADFQAEGERTGSYILAGEEFTLNDAGESVISYADYAIALIDEAERTDGSHEKARISVLGK